MDFLKSPLRMVNLHQSKGKKQAYECKILRISLFMTYEYYFWLIFFGSRHFYTKKLNSIIEIFEVMFLTFLNIAL